MRATVPQNSLIEKPRSQAYGRSADEIGSSQSVYLTLSQLYPVFRRFLTRIHDRGGWPI